MIKSVKLIFVFLLVLSSTRYFGARFFNPSFVNYSQFALAFFSVLISLPYFFPRHRTGFVFPIQLISVAIMISILMAYLFWNQSIKDSLLVTIPMFLWPFFFYLNSIKIPIKILENIVLFLGGVYILIYFYQFFNPAVVLFGKPNYGTEFYEDRGVIRIIPPGGGLFFLAVFIALTRLTTQKRRKWLWFTFISFGILLPILQVTRVSVFGVGVIYFFHFLKEQNLPKKVFTAVCSVLLVICIAAVYTEIKPLHGMVKAQEDISKEGDKYIRVLAANYYLNEFSPSKTNEVFGNGVPYVDFTAYGRFVHKLNDEYGYFLEDLGIISIYIMFGIFAVIAYLLIWVKSFRYSIPQNYQYVKYHLWFLLISAFTTVNLYSPDHLISTVLSLYIFHVIVVNQKQAVVQVAGNVLMFPPYAYKKPNTMLADK